MGKFISFLLQAAIVVAICSLHVALYIPGLVILILLGGKLLDNDPKDFKA